MKLKDLVANSLPRVRGRKSKKSAHLLPSNHNMSSKQEPEFSTHAPYFMQHQHPAFESRESSVERSSTVAVVDAPWRDGAAYTSQADKKLISPCDMGLVTQSMTYYTPLTHQQHGMVMSHSADGISAQAMLLASPRDYAMGSKVTSLSDHYAITGYRHPNMAANSETAVNYVGPNYVYHSQHQHQHHHHHHSHDHHYVYHHHHHDRQQYHPQHPPQATKPDPLTERNCHQTYTATAQKQTQQGAADKPRKSEPGGFLRKSFASFKAMRKPGSRNKEKETRINQLVDENDKCLICPYPQPQFTDKNGSHKKSSKQSKKEMKSLMKSMKNKHSSSHEKQSDSSWCSDDAKKYNQSHHHLHGYDSVPYPTMNAFPVRECSMESSISRHTVAGSRERVDQQNFETASLSGYDSDVTKNRTGRSRSRIKTNPWLPSPQPSLTMGRRFDKRHARDSNDVMEDESPGCFPRSASFDYHSQLGVSTFLSSGGQNDQKKHIQRHRSLTPVDLKLNLSLPRPKKAESPKPLDGKNHLNDLNTNLTKSRPNSIISPNSEFVALADNIEQLANNISFEYEDNFDKSLPKGENPGRAMTPKEQCVRLSEESNSKKRKSESSPTLPIDGVSDSAHSPDSGIGCLGSCDGDDSMTLGNTITLEQSPTVSIPSSHSTNSDSLNSTPKRKTSKNPRQTVDGKSAKRLTSFPSAHCHDNERDMGIKDRNAKPVCESRRDGLRMLVSSSNESITSAVVSESDIDNTSYKFVDSSSLNGKEPAIVSDPYKPQNVTPCLMVDERLDINFRSLPRKLNGKPGRTRCENDGRFTISRSKNVIVENECPPSLILFHNDSERPSALSLSQVTRSKTGNCEGNCEEIESGLYPDIGETECEMAVNFVNLDHPPLKSEAETGDSVTMDTVDACVQTDFLLDSDTWERKQPSGLSPLDDSFDPAESTRRWLISGNMQGSADTGYSSQPRDSHVFMEEEAALLQLETLSDTSGHSIGLSKAKTMGCGPSSRGKLSPLECETQCNCSMCNSCSNQATSKRSDNGCHSYIPSDSDRVRNADLFSDCALSNLLYGLKPPYENDFDDVNVAGDSHGASTNGKLQVNKRQRDEKSIAASDVNKRHSSDSSTSTLTSDVAVMDRDSENFIFENSSDNSFLFDPSRQKDDSRSCGSKKDTTNDDYHDYVNLPVRFFGAKSQLKVSLPSVNNSDLCYGDGCFNDKVKCPKNKCAECSRIPKSQVHPHHHTHHHNHPHHKSSQFESSHKTRANSEERKNLGGKELGKNAQFRFLDSILSHEDRPDYLEFLRDAPLHQPQSTRNQIFIVPGFGPLEYPTEIHLPHNKGHFRNELNTHDRKSMSPVCVKKSSLSNTAKSTTKPKKEDRPTNLKLLSHNSSCLQSMNNDNLHNAISLEQNKKDGKGQSAPYVQTKRKPHKDTTNKPERCPTVRSYDVDDFAPINRVDLTSSSPVSASTPPPSSSTSFTSTTSSASSSRQDKSGTTRNLAERVAMLRREKEIIYRKIQEVQQQQELDRHREQFQQHRNLHSQRKDELLETLRVLKEKLEEQSKTLHMKCREEI